MTLSDPSLLIFWFRQPVLYFNRKWMALTFIGTLNIPWMNTRRHNASEDVWRAGDDCLKSAERAPRNRWNSPKSDWSTGKSANPIHTFRYHWYRPHILWSVFQYSYSSIQLTHKINLHILPAWKSNALSVIMRYIPWTISHSCAPARLSRRKSLTSLLRREAILRR